MSTVQKTGAESALITMIALDKLVPSPTNPRQTFDEAKLKELADSIASKGLIQPIVVRKHPKNGGRFEIVAGERRYRAAKLAKLSQVPGIVRTLGDQEVVEFQIIENSQREDVAPLEEAEGFAKLMKMDPAKYTADSIAEKIGKSKSYVYMKLKLVDLVPSFKKMLRAGDITEGHAILLARLSPQLQEAAAKQWFENRRDDDVMSVRELARSIKDQLQIDLHSAPFKKDATTFIALVDVGNPAAKRVGPHGHVGKGETIKDAWQLPACAICPQRAGSIPHLFIDVEKGDTCTNPICFREKQVSALLARRKELSEQMGVEVSFGAVGYIYERELDKRLADGIVRVTTSSYDTSHPQLVPDGARIFGERRKHEAVLADKAAPAKAKESAKKALAKLPTVTPHLLVYRERHPDPSAKQLKVGDVIYSAKAHTVHDRVNGVSKVVGVKTPATTLVEKQKNARRRLQHRVRILAGEQLVAKVKHPLPVKALGIITRVMAEKIAGWNSEGHSHPDVHEDLRPKINPLKVLGLKKKTDLEDGTPDLLAKALVRYAVHEAIDNEWGQGQNVDDLKALAEIFDVDLKALETEAMKYASKHDTNVLAAKPQTSAPKEKSSAKADRKKR